MSRTIASLEAEVLSLPEEPRLELLHRLLQSFYGGRSAEEARIAAVWMEEAVRRDQEMESGGEAGVAAEELFAQLRSSRR
jgi:hypothetical protein